MVGAPCRRTWIFVTAVFLNLFSCGQPAEKETIGNNAFHQDSEILSGKQLSQKYCQSCHLYPEPGALDKATWERSVLPLMGRFFGIYEKNVPRSEILNGAIDKMAVEEQNLFPKQPLISDGDWAKITAFYLSEAPENLPLIERKESNTLPIDGFDIVVPTVATYPQTITLIKLHPEDPHIYVGESRGTKGALTILDKQFKVVDSLPLPSAPTDLSFGKDEVTLTLAGALRLATSDNSFGELLSIFRKPGDLRYSAFRKFLQELNRPVQSVLDDVTGNGLVDILIAEFGFYTGSLTLFENIGLQQNPFKKRILKNVPGAVRTYIRDMDGDGLKDIISLFAQGDEGISIFYNQGGGEFREERILKFPPTYGSVYFELIDFNMDGYPDILFCNGDNGDYPPILKDYHGIRIFENDGKNNFSPVYFFPMYGVIKCAAADFDLNGKLDIVGISQFPEVNSPLRQELVLLKNDGENQFTPRFLQEGIPGPWTTFEIADLNGDGYLDILLGAFRPFSSPLSRNPVPNNKSLMILKNKAKN